MRKLLMILMPALCSMCSLTAQTPDSSQQQTRPLVCNLTSTDLQNRKNTVIAQLKALVKERKELENGYAYRFEATDPTLDVLMEFVKSERQCCDFFNFTIEVKEENVVWFHITGPTGTKGFITSELEF